MDAFVDFCKNHWFFAVPMFLMSLAAVSMLAWRLMLNMNAKTDLNLFLPRFQEIMQKEGIEGGLKFCKAQPPSEVIPRKLFVAGLDTAKQGTAAMRRAMANIMELEVIPDLNFLLSPILAIAKIATMVGLLGTVISMIDTFQSLGKAKDAADGTGGGAADTSSAIGLALFATALGLMTAIPLVFAHVLMKNWIHTFEVKMKSSGAKLMLLVQQLRNAPPPTSPPGGPPGQPGQRPMAAGAPVRPGA